MIVVDSLATSVKQHPPRYWSADIMHRHVTWVMALDGALSQWPAPSPDHSLNIDAPSAPLCVVVVWHWHFFLLLQPPTCPRCWSRSRCVRGRARAAVSGEDARARLRIISLHPGVWPPPPLPPPRGRALCRPTSAPTRRGETWRRLRSEGGNWRILERPSLQVGFWIAAIHPSGFPPSSR